MRQGTRIEGDSSSSSARFAGSSTGTTSPTNSTTAIRHTAHPLPGLSRNAVQRSLAAICELVARAGLSHRRPAFGIDTVTIQNRLVAVRETAIHRTPFCTLLRLEKDLTAPQPRVLLVAPMSGHFATLPRGTAQTLLADHDVYITDWHNIRDVSLHHGRFDFDDFVDHVITFLQVLGPGTH